MLLMNLQGGAKMKLLRLITETSKTSVVKKCTLYNTRTRQVNP